MSPDIYAKAADLLARRPHFRRELEAKLARRGFDEQEIRRVCDRLERERILDDVECGRQLTEGPLRRKGFGPRRVRAELLRRGARAGVIEALVSEAFADGELAGARAVARRWLGLNPADGPRLARHLDRMGYSAPIVIEVLEERGLRLQTSGAGRSRR